MNQLDLSLRLSWFALAAAPLAAQPTANLPRLSTPGLLPAPWTTSADSDLLLGPGPLSLSQTVEPVTPPVHPALNDTWFFGVGTTLMTSNTQAQLSGNSGAGAVIDFEDAFGLEETKWVPQGIGRWRFTERWRLEFEYFSLTRSNSRTLQNDITWGDTVIPAGSEAKADFDVSVARLSCGYSFFKTVDKEIGVALGFHLTDINAEVSTSGGSGDEGKLLAPLPVVSMYGQFALTDKWAVQARLDAFRMSYDPFDGRVLSIATDALYQPWRNFGFGLGWRTLQIEGGVDGSDWKGDIATTYTGPVLFVSTSF